MATRSLAGIDLADADARGVDLAGAQLNGANLDRAALGPLWVRTAAGRRMRREAVLVRADLTNAHLSGADLRRADLAHADLVGADLADAVASRARLRYADARRADMHGARLVRADLRDADLRGADLRDADLRTASLEGADLRGARLEGAHLRGASLRRARIDHHALDGVPVCKVVMPASVVGVRDCPASDARLPDVVPTTRRVPVRPERSGNRPAVGSHGGAGAARHRRRLGGHEMYAPNCGPPGPNLDCTWFWAPRPGLQVGPLDMHGTDFSNANLSGWDFSPANTIPAPLGANMRQTNWAYALMDGTSFPQADFTQSDMYLAQFIGADLQWVNLQGAFLGWTNFTGADLTGANLSGATEGLLPATFAATQFTGATMPGALLQYGNFRGSQFSFADLRGANLAGADLSMANFDSADLTGANLLGANLDGAQFDNANLTGAQLTGVYGASMNFQNTNFTGATGEMFGGAPCGDPNARGGATLGCPPHGFPLAIDLMGYTCYTTLPGGEQDMNDCQILSSLFGQVAQAVASISGAFPDPSIAGDGTALGGIIDSLEKGTLDALTMLKASAKDFLLRVGLFRIGKALWYTCGEQYAGWLAPWLAAIAKAETVAVANGTVAVLQGQPTSQGGTPMPPLPPLPPTFCWSGPGTVQ